MKTVLPKSQETQNRNTLEKAKRFSTGKLQPIVQNLGKRQQFVFHIVRCAPVWIPLRLEQFFFSFFSFVIASIAYITAKIVDHVRVYTAASFPEEPGNGVAYTVVRKLNLHQR